MGDYCKFVNAFTALNPFKPKSPHHFFCTKKHRQTYNDGKDWESFFKKLLRNNGKERKALSCEHLLKLYDKQKGRCALSGVELTKVTGKGSVTTNASIDRIRPGKAYTKNNIRLVCTFVNSFRGCSDDISLLWWCKNIVGKLDD